MRDPDLAAQERKSRAWRSPAPLAPNPDNAADPGRKAGPARFRPLLEPAPAGEERNTANRRGRYKRPFDLCLVMATLLPLLPVWVVLCVAIPLAIRLESRGPPLYRQTRLGRGGRAFTVIKFRTMIDGAEAHTGPVWAAWRDARTTRVGRVLRRLHLDELPQLVNVLRGEMSLVGPRPERPELAARFEREIPDFRVRLRVRPGIMGLAQARSAYNLHPRHKLHYDMLYMSRMSPWLDLKLCVLCVRKVLRKAVLQGRRTAAPGPDNVSPAGHG